MSEKRILLSERLQMLASMVTPGNRVADVGCDHGFLPVWLVQNGMVPGALAMDVRKGPLEAAREHIAECGLGEYISTRISDGLKEYHIGEAETIVCAGMGGRLMEKILTESMEKAKSVKELILQPQSELCEFRRFLRSAGFRVLGEDAVFEDGKYYFALKAVPGSAGKTFAAEPIAATGNIARMEKKPVADAGTGTQEELLLQDMYGKFLLAERHPVLQQYLFYHRNILHRLEETVSGGTERTQARLREIKEELAMVEKALSYFG